MHGQLDEEHPEPAGFPAAVARTIGQGRMVHLCTDLFGHYYSFGDPQVLRWLRELVDGLFPQPLFRTSAPSWVDVSLRRRGEAVLVHFLNTNPGRDLCRLGTDDTWVDEVPQVGPFDCELRLPGLTGHVSWEPDGQVLEGTSSGGVLRFVVPRFQIHGCAVVR
jgi:hypothetical protein